MIHPRTVVVGAAGGVEVPVTPCHCKCHCHWQPRHGVRRAATVAVVPVEECARGM